MKSCLVYTHNCTKKHPKLILYYNILLIWQWLYIMLWKTYPPCVGVPATYARQSCSTWRITKFLCKGWTWTPSNVYRSIWLILTSMEVWLLLCYSRCKSVDKRFYHTVKLSHTIRTKNRHQPNPKISFQRYSEQNLFMFFFFVWQFW